MSEKIADLQRRYDLWLLEHEGRGISYGELAHIEALTEEEQEDFDTELADEGF